MSIYLQFELHPKETSSNFDLPSSKEEDESLDHVSKCLRDINERFPSNIDLDEKLNELKKLSAEIIERIDQVPKSGIRNLPLLVRAIQLQIKVANIDVDSNLHHRDLASLTKILLDTFIYCSQIQQAKLDQERVDSEILKIYQEQTAACYIEIAKIETRKETKKTLAKSGIVAKLKNDPKQAAKADIAMEYKLWKSNQTTYRSAAAFAVKMVMLYPDLRTKTVESWVTQWGKEQAKKCQTP